MATISDSDHSVSPMVSADPPFVEDTPRYPATAPAPKSQGTLWRFRFPWVKTAVGAPTYNNVLQVVNHTVDAWMVWHNYHWLGALEPETERTFQVVRAGTLSARPRGAGPESEYLLISLAPHLVGVEIVDLDGDGSVYVLRPISDPDGTSAEPPDSTPIKELKLSFRTQRALRRIGVTTYGELRRADLGALWDAHDGAAAYAELVAQLSVWRSSRTEGEDR